MEERDPTPARAGDLFRHYRVIAKVGQGGMRAVYRAHDTRLQRDVALKYGAYCRGAQRGRDTTRRKTGLS